MIALKGECGGAGLNINQRGLNLGPPTHKDGVVIGEIEVLGGLEEGTTETHIHRTVVQREEREDQAGSIADETDLATVTDNKVPGPSGIIVGLEQQKGLVDQEGTAGAGDQERVIGLPKVEALAVKNTTGRLPAPEELKGRSIGDNE